MPDLELTSRIADEFEGPLTEDLATQWIESEFGDLLAAISAGDPNAESSISSRSRTLAKSIMDNCNPKIDYEAGFKAYFETVASWAPEFMRSRDHVMKLIENIVSASVGTR